MVKKVSLLLALCIFICFFSTGCYDAEEVDDEVYALMLGIDKGTTNSIRLTIQYPTYKSGGGGGGGGGGEDNKGGMGGSNEAPGSNIHTIEAPTVLEALDMYGMAISRRVSLMHAKNLIISEEVAREGMERYLAPLARYREARRIVNIAVVKGTAQKYIQNNKSNIGESLSKAMELMSVQADNTSFFPRVDFFNFYKSLLSSYQQGYTAYTGINDFKELSDKIPPGKAPQRIDNGYEPGKLPRSGVAKREFVGTTVFNKDRMVGYFNSEETRYFLMVKGRFRRGIITLKDQESPGDSIPLDFRPSRKPVIKGYFKNGKPYIFVKLEMEADIGSIQSRIYYEDKDKLDKLNKQASKFVQDRVVEVIGKAQYIYKSDIFGFGQKLAGYFPNIQEWEKYNWLSKFDQAKISVAVNVNIRRTGLMIRSSNIKGLKH